MALRGVDIKIFSGQAHTALAREIVRHLDLPLGDVKLTRFSDGESYCQFRENIRGTDVFIIQPTSTPANENLMELLIMLDAAKRASADRITAVIPYYGYARQDRKDKPRVPITSKLVADLLTTAGADRILVIDLHAPAIQAFFDIPVDHLFAGPVLMEEIRKMKLENLAVVSPDAGGVERARAYAKRLEADLIIVDKRRSGDGTSEVMHVIGDAREKSCVIVDDIIATAGTVVGTSKALRQAGARRVLGCFSHGVLAGPAMERIAEARLEELLITNTIPIPDERIQQAHIRSVNIAPLLGEAINRIHNNSSVSSLFQ
ncbi:MAG: ribose-phosphate pyrophosphokinase [Acidobacteria bacterium]|nr:MAG: ribose-phosphate pyrophosphokinase [Acidobacteriota bacterium]